MEKLTELRFEGTPRVQAWCESCKEWKTQVDLCLDCYTPSGLKDYVYCLECGEALIVSE